MNNIINSYELIITELNQKEFTSTLDILNEFVLSNMKDVSNTNKLIGIKTQQNLIMRYYSFKKIKTNFLQGTWDTILNCLDQEEYNYKKELLENIDLLIDKTREDIIITSNEEPPTSGYDYIYDPRFYYNYGYYDAQNGWIHCNKKNKKN